MSLLNPENNNCTGIAVLRIRNSFTSQNSKVFKKVAKTFSREIIQFFQLLYGEKFLFSIDWGDIPTILETLLNVRVKLFGGLK